MENVADALKIAFSIFVFVIAITVLFSLVSQARSTADIVLYYADDTNFYDHSDSTTLNRSVTTADVISTLYRYYKESICVTIILSDGTIATFDLKNGSYADAAEIEQNLSNFIKSHLNDLNMTFEENFVEAPISGIYQTGIDGSEITLSSGGKKIYITYLQQ